MIDAISKVYQYDYTAGTLMGEIPLPGLGTAGGFGGKKGSGHALLFIFQLSYSRKHLCL